MDQLNLDTTMSTAGSGVDKVGIAVGSRAHLEAEAIAKRHWVRNFLMRGFHLLVMIVAGGKIRDTQCGFKVSRQLPCEDLDTSKRNLHQEMQLQQLHRDLLWMDIGALPGLMALFGGGDVQICYKEHCCQ